MLSQKLVQDVEQTGKQVLGAFDVLVQPFDAPSTGGGREPAIWRGQGAGQPARNPAGRAPGLATKLKVRRRGHAKLVHLEAELLGRPGFEVMGLVDDQVLVLGQHPFRGPGRTGAMRG